MKLLNWSFWQGEQESPIIEFNKYPILSKRREYTLRWNCIRWSFNYVINNIVNKKSFLDVGCGGNFLPFYLSSIGKTYAVDVEKFDYGKNIVFIQTPIENKNLLIDIPKLDCIICVAVLHLIKNKALAIEIFNQLLLPGGKLVITLDCNYKQNLEILKLLEVENKIDDLPTPNDCISWWKKDNNYLTDIKTKEGKEFFTNKIRDYTSLGMVLSKE